MPAGTKRTATPSDGEQLPVDPVKTTERNAEQGEWTEIFTGLTAKCADQVTDSLLSWSALYENELSEFRGIRKECLNLAGRLRTENVDADRFWEDLTSLIDRTLGWMEKIGEDDMKAASSENGAGWWTRFSSSIGELPEQAVFEVQDEFWNDLPGERAWTRATKLKERFRRRVIRRFAGAKASIPVEKRTVPVRPFIESFIGVPANRILFSEWQSFLQHLSASRQQLREVSQEMLSDLVMIPNGAVSDRTAEEGHERITAFERKYSAESADPRIAWEEEAIGRCRTGFNSIRDSASGKWKTAGTSLLPAEGFRPSRNREELEALAGEFGRTERAWLTHSEGARDDWKHDLMLSLLMVESSRLCQTSIRSISGRSRDDIAVLLKPAAELLSKAAADLRTGGDTSGEGLREKILSQNRSLVRTLRKQTIPGALSAIEKAQLAKVAENFLSRLLHHVDSLPESCRIFEKNDFLSLIPDSSFIDIPLQDLVRAEVVPSLEENHEAFMDSLKEDLGRILRDVAELDQAVEFHLESALELLEEGREGDFVREAEEVAAEGLSRTRALVERILLDQERVAAAAAQALVRMTVEFNRRLIELTDNERIIALRAKVVKARVKDEIESYQESFLGFSRRTLPRLNALIAKHGGRLRNRLSALRKAAGLTGVSAADEADLARWINETRARVADLPFPYRRLFRTDPLEDTTFFEGRTADLAAVRADFIMWREIRNGAMALIGEKGSGKTTLLQCMAAEGYTGFSVTRINLAGKSISTESGLADALAPLYGAETVGNGIDELERRLAALRQPIVVVVEDIQNLFLRTVGGFQALERFLQLISATSHTVYWVVTCSRYTWQYFEKVLTIGRFFRAQISLGGLEHADIGNIIMRRHRMSGYEVRFDSPPAIEESKSYQELTTDEERQKYLRERWFDEVNDFVAGNITVALTYWLASCGGVKENVLTVSSNRPDTDALSGLPPADLFTLGAILQHEALDAPTHSLIFHQTLPQSLLHLGRLSGKGILVERTDGFHINPILYRAIVRTLMQKNILH